MNKNKVSMAVIRRLPRYYRYLGELLKNDITKVSSKDLSEKMGFTASQIDHQQHGAPPPGDQQQLCYGGD